MGRKKKTEEVTATKKSKKDEKVEVAEKAEVTKPIPKVEEVSIEKLAEELEKVAPEPAKAVGEPEKHALVGKRYSLTKARVLACREMVVGVMTRFEMKLDDGTTVLHSASELRDLGL